MERPGAVVAAEEVLAAGWPGERVLPEAGAKRVRTAIWSLRKAGLGEPLETVGDAYRLDPARLLDIVPASGSPL